VRIVSDGALHGRCGTVDGHPAAPSQLCGEEARHDTVTSWLEQDLRGHFMLEDEQQHHVLLDAAHGGEETLVRLPPHEAEAWPRVGQRVRLLDPLGGIGEALDSACFVCLIGVTDRGGSGPAEINS